MLPDTYGNIVALANKLNSLPQYVAVLIRKILEPVLLYNSNRAYVDRAIRDRANHYETLLAFLNYPYPFTGIVQRLHGPFMLPRSGANPYPVSLLPPNG